MVARWLFGGGASCLLCVLVLGLVNIFGFSYIGLFAGTTSLTHPAWFKTTIFGLQVHRLVAREQTAAEVETANMDMEMSPDLLAEENYTGQGGF